MQLQPNPKQPDLSADSWDRLYTRRQAGSQLPDMKNSEYRPAYRDAAE